MVDFCFWIQEKLTRRCTHILKIKGKNIFLHKILREGIVCSCLARFIDFHLKKERCQIL